MTDFKDRISGLSPKRLALLAVELQKRVERLESRRSEPIAVVGLGCRFPGDAGSPDAYWRMLSDGVDGIRDVPADRWDADTFYDPDPKAPGKMITRSGGFIDEIDQFDAAFFGITHREAASLDPRYRILLEVVWEALEHAGLAPDSLLGSQTGVFVGACGSDYNQLLIEGQPDTLDAYLVSGSATSMAAGRISYALGLQGPALSVDTACSSSLVAVHLACQALRADECDMAIASGTTLILAPEVSIGLSSAEMLSPDGRCKTFDADADGIGRGEGCGVVVLKRLSDATADGDRILAVLQGTAINQDGRSGGITAPNGPSQEAVIRDALRRSGLKPADVSYIEAHGTGTTLGDPIEVRALDAVFGPDRDAARPLMIGSVKTNFGHLEASAGIAGLIKVVLALGHEQIPPHLHLREPNPHIEWDDLCVTIPSDGAAWRRGDAPRIAGVSSFGFSGTNAHVIVEEAPASPGVAESTDRDTHILSLSARSAPALDALVARFLDDLAANPDRAIADVCHTANVGRAQLEERIAVVAESQDVLAQRLAALRQQQQDADAQRGRVASSKPPEVVFLFPGYGVPDALTARRLYASEPVVRDAIDRCIDHVTPALGASIRSMIVPDSESAAGMTDDPRHAQVAAFAWQFALAELWRSWGIRPAVATGYDVGEFVAACIARVFELEDALDLVITRAELAQGENQGRSLCAVFAAAETIAARIDAENRPLEIAAINGPAHAIVSGPAADVEAFCEALAADAVDTQAITASPRALSGVALDAFEQAVARCALGMPEFGLVSCTTGRLATPAELSSPEYWRRQSSETIDFAAAIRFLGEEGYRHYLESGPAPVLAPLGRRVLVGDDATWLPSLTGDADGESSLLRSLAALYVRGARVDWRAFHRARSGRVVTLPTYAFQHRRHWVTALPGKAEPAERPAWRDWLYDFRWHALSQRPGSAADLNPPDRIATIAAAHIEPLAEQAGIAIYREFEPRFDELCSGYILEALDRLGWNPAGSRDPISATALRERLGILPEHIRLFNRMLEILAEDGVLVEDGAGGYTPGERPEPTDLDALASELQAAYPECGAELDLTIDCGRSLAEVLNGTCDPMQLLFPDGSLVPTERLYQESAGLRMFNSLVRESIVAACAELAPDRKLRILELGAGTGAATSYILPALRPDQTEYVFTDVSNAFLVAAQQKFRDFPFVEYRLFDAGRSPIEQGFEAGEFDIVIAANVIHATPDLRETLANIKTVLAPVGMVVLLEGTVKQRFGDLTVGLTPGWWSFEDVDLRPDYALLTAPEWRDLFTDCGFESVAAIPDGQHPLGGAVNQQSVMVARLPETVAGQPDVEAAGDWAIFCDDDGIGDALAAAVVAGGGRSFVIRKGDAFSVDDGDTFTIDPLDPAHFSQLIDTLAGDGSVSLRGVVHCWAIDERIAGNDGLEALAGAQQRACGSALYLAQALAKSAIASRPGVTLVTRGSQSASIDEACPGFTQAALWGLARVIELEHPELRCKIVDLDDETPADAATVLFDRVLTADTPENQLVLRGGRLRVLRATPSEEASAAHAMDVDVLSDASYLVTGGLSGLGLLVAQWLFEQGARHLILVGRRPPGDEALAAIDRMQSDGARVSVVQGDIATGDCLSDIEGTIAAGGEALRGVVHCAGAIDDGALLQQDWARFERVMAAKVSGSWNLHRLSDAWPLDFFVLFSTGASFLGSPGQSNHAAANAFMDALAHYRRALGLSAVTINWGAWSETGAAVRTGVADFAKASGMGTISPKQGLAILESLLRHDAPTQVAVLPAKPERLISTHQTGRPIPVFEELARIAAESTGADAEGAEPTAGQRELLAALESAAPKARRNLLMKQIQAAAVKIMGLAPGEVIDPRRPLIDLGLDSLMAVELRNSVGGLVNRSLPATLLFNYPSISELVDHLLGDVLNLTSSDPGDARQAAAEDETAARDAELDQLGEDEIADLLANRLTDLDHAS